MKPVSDASADARETLSRAGPPGTLCLVLETESGRVEVVAERVHRVLRPHRTRHGAWHLELKPERFNGPLRTRGQQNNDREVHNLLKPLLDTRYGSRTGLCVLELGSAETTSVANVLREQLQLYVGLDFSRHALMVQRMLLRVEEVLAGRTSNMLADTYDLPLRDGSIDLVIAVYHPPFASSRIVDQNRALNQIWRVLGEGGECLLFPWYFGAHPDRVYKCLLRLFEVRRIEKAGGSHILVLRKKMYPETRRRNAGPNCDLLIPVQYSQRRCS